MRTIHQFKEGRIKHLNKSEVIDRKSSLKKFLSFIAYNIVKSLEDLASKGFRINHQTLMLVDFFCFVNNLILPIRI